MKASERRLLMVFLAVGGVLAAVLAVHFLRGWQHGLERRERDVQLAQMEGASLLAESTSWKARGAWLEQVLPAAASELDANQGLLDTLQNSAREAGLEITKTQIEPQEEKAYYRQFGVSLTVKGALPAFMRWIHARLDPSMFYVLPSLRVTPDKDDPAKIIAQVRIWRWYATGTPMTVAHAASETPLRPPE